MTKRIIEAPVKLSKSVDGLHTLQFNEASHRYKLDGKAVPGVTTFTHDGYPTSRNLISWMIGQGAEYVWNNTTLSSIDESSIGFSGKTWSKEDKKDIIKDAKLAHKQKSADAAAIGTYVHDVAYYTELGQKEKAAELIVNAIRQPNGELIVKGINKFLDWKKDNIDEMVFSEQLVASVIHSFCGKFDRLVRRNGRLILSDFKTSSGIFVDHFIQMAAYALGIKEWLGMDVEALEVLRFGKEDGEFQTLLIDKPEEIKAFQEQAIRCRQTYQFKKIENDERFVYGGKK